MSTPRVYKFDEFLKHRNESINFPLFELEETPTPEQPADTTADTSTDIPAEPSEPVATETPTEPEIDLGTTVNDEPKPASRKELDSLRKDYDFIIRNLKLQMDWCESKKEIAPNTKKLFDRLVKAVM